MNHISNFSCMEVVASRLKYLIVWPDRGAICYNLAQCFKKKYRDAICIIDCSKIFIQRPSNLTARAQTWSNYKHNNTSKYLIGVSPDGSIMFLSSGWGGRVSDKQITIESGFIEKLEVGDCILAHRGFNFKEELAVKGAISKIPNFTKGKKRLDGSDVTPIVICTYSCGTSHRESKEISHIEFNYPNHTS